MTDSPLELAAYVLVVALVAVALGEMVGGWLGFVTAVVVSGVAGAVADTVLRKSK